MPFDMGAPVSDANPMPVTSVAGASTSVVGSVAHDAADSGAPVKIGFRAVTVPVAVADLDRVDARSDTRGNQYVLPVFSTGATSFSTGAIGGSLSSVNGSNVVYPGVIGYRAAGATAYVETKPSATSRIISAAASTNASVAKASAGDLFRVSGYNANAAGRWLKIYNKATAPTVGTDTPLWSEYLPPLAKFEINLAVPFFFSTGISYALTTGSADADTGALTAGDILGLTLAYA